MINSFSIRKILLYVALIVAALSFVYPFLWMIGASFAPMEEVGRMTLWPDNPGWGNFRTMVAKIPIGRSLVNSLLVATITTVLVMVTGSTVGYALAKMRFRGRQLILSLIHI